MRRIHFLFAFLCILMKWWTIQGDCDFTTDDQLSLIINSEYEGPVNENETDGQGHEQGNEQGNERGNEQENERGKGKGKGKGKEDNKNVIKDINNNYGATNNHIKHCVRFVNHFKTLKFICPKQGENYEGIEIRPSNCFQMVRVNGIPNLLSAILKGSSSEIIEHDNYIESKVFIPPSVPSDMILECSCDNSLTFRNRMNGYRGVMRIHLKKKSIAGCDFNYMPELNEKSSFTKYYKTSDLLTHGITNCDVQVTSNEVNMGIICPQGYTLYPDKCFHNVLVDNKVTPLNSLINNSLDIYTDPSGAVSFAYFILEYGDRYPDISCQCIDQNDSNNKITVTVKSIAYQSSAQTSFFSFFIL